MFYVVSQIKLEIKDTIVPFSLLLLCRFLRVGSYCCSFVSLSSLKK